MYQKLLLVSYLFLLFCNVNISYPLFLMTFPFLLFSFSIFVLFLIRLVMYITCVCVTLNCIVSIGTGVKKYRVPKIESYWALVPIEYCVKWYGMHQCFLSRSHFTPYMSMEGGALCYGGLPMFLHRDVWHFHKFLNKFNIYKIADNCVIGRKWAYVNFNMNPKTISYCIFLGAIII